MHDKKLRKFKVMFAIAFGLVVLLLASLSFAAPPLPPPEPVPLFGEEILIPTLVGYGLYRLRRNKKQG